MKKYTGNIVNIYAPANWITRINKHIPKNIWQTKNQEIESPSQILN